MKKKFFVGACCILSIIIGLIIWNNIIKAKKEIMVKIEWGTHIESQKRIPIIEIFYSWNDILDQEPNWIIMPSREGNKFLVTDFKKIRENYSEARSEEDRTKAMHLPDEEFTDTWVLNRLYEPTASVRETILKTLGFENSFKSLLQWFGLNPIFHAEKAAFEYALAIVHDINSGMQNPNDADPLIQPKWRIMGTERRSL